MSAKNLKGGEYRALDVSANNYHVSILKNHIKYLFGGEICLRNYFRL